MSATKLDPSPTERIWGRGLLPPDFQRFNADGKVIGEICYGDTVTRRRTDLLVKYLFTSEVLSVQVHPPSPAAIGMGLPVGKDEAWLVLSADEGARIGLGLREPVTAAALRRAALDGSIEQMIDWRPVRAGDFLYSPAGTIHAIGGGLVLVEVQQNLNMTYRLYDHGRQRALHIDEAIAVATLEPLGQEPRPRTLADGRVVLSSGREVVVERWTMRGPTPVDAADAPLLLIPLGSGGVLDGAPMQPGTVWRIDGDPASILSGEIDLLIAYPGPAIRTGIGGAPRAGRGDGSVQPPDRRGRRSAASAIASFTR